MKIFVQQFIFELLQRMFIDADSKDCRGSGISGKRTNGGGDKLFQPTKQQGWRIVFLLKWQKLLAVSLAQAQLWSPGSCRK